jgi:hypothetical protein
VDSKSRLFIRNSLYDLLDSGIRYYAYQLDRVSKQNTRCPPRQKSRVERLKKVEPLLSLVKVTMCFLGGPCVEAAEQAERRHVNPLDDLVNLDQEVVKK